MKNLIKRGKKLYWWLIATFAILYLAVAFVSTLHAITFFQLANTLGLAILLGAAYEVGQAAVLFSILMSENRNRILAWAMMFLLTALQITANVYASFKFMIGTGSEDWTFWQRAILFGFQADSPEMYKVIISWISGALLPLVALGMTALVADNIRMARGEKLGGDDSDEEVEHEIPEESKTEEDFELIEDKEEKYVENAEKMAEDILETGPAETLEKRQLPNLGEALEVKSPIVSESYPSLEEATEKFEKSILDKKEKQPIFESPIKVDKIEDRKPVNKIRGWHFRDEFIDKEHNIFKKGKWVGKDISKIPTEPKKA
jgi:hypothetical protein